MVVVTTMSRDVGIYLVAECGCSWDTKPRLKRLIKDCLDAGADAVKLQLFNAKTIADYPPSLRERLTPMILEIPDLCELSTFVHANGGELVVTPMYVGAMDKLLKVKPFPVDGFKVRGKDFTNLPLLKEIVSRAGDRPVYISIPHDAEGNVPAVEDGTWQTTYSTNCYSVFCRPEYPPKLNTLGVWKSLTMNGVSLHSPDWTVHAAACAMHIGYEERRPREHIKRFYCEVHVMPKEPVCVVGETTYTSPLDKEVSLSVDDLAKLSKTIKSMEEAIG